MRILFIHSESISGTGGATYAGQLIKAVSARHETHLLRDPSDLDRKWDVIHALNIKHFDPVLLNKIRAPLTVDVHDAHWAPGEPIYPTPDLPVRWALARIRRNRYKPVLDKAAAVIVHSRYVASRIGMNKARFVPYAVQAMAPGPHLPERPSVAIFAGRDYFRKGLPVLLDAWRHVSVQRPGSRLEIAGREFIHGRLYARIFANRKGITLLGGIPRDELLEHIRNARVLALPSWTESFGIVLLEAMAVGTPVVGTMAGGIPEALAGGEGGILVERGNSRALAAALIRCMDNDPDLVKITRRGFEIAAAHSIDAMVKAVEDVYREAARI